jgi:flavin reductase (DIM6/NTAB) family NADH-FMN oxidoreductase RutF
MKREKIDFTEHFEVVMGAMQARGLLLGAYDATGRANAMAIGWGSLGSIWGMPIWIVLVRPSRYTYQCIEHTGCFSVNVAGAELESAVMLCGTKSGRDGDKLAEARLAAEKGTSVLAPTIAECPIVYECQVMHRNDVLPDELVRELQEGPYASGDYHRVYFGRILSAAAAKNAGELLR